MVWQLQWQWQWQVEFGAMNAETYKDFARMRFQLSSYPTCVDKAAVSPGR